MTVQHWSSGAVRVGRDNRHDWEFQSHPEPWMRSGLCGQSDPDLWFPDQSGDVRIPKRICAACPVRPRCLEFALDHDYREGVWGGLSALEREKLRLAANRELRTAS